MAREFPIIRRLGGRDASAEKLRQLGHEISRDGLRMWAARGSIPGDATRLLMRIADQERIAYGSADFELEEEPAEAPRNRPADEAAA